MSFRLGHLVDLTQAQQDVAVNSLRNGGTALLVGQRTRKHWGSLASHPRVVIWCEEELSRRKEVPSNVRVVVMTRFISHNYSEAVMKQCDRRGIHCIRVDSVTQARGLVEPALAAEPPRLVKSPEQKAEEQMAQTINVAAAAKAAEEKPEPTPTQEAPTRQLVASKGALRSFLQRRPDLDRLIRMPRNEAAAIVFDAAKVAVPTTTLDSIKQSLYTLAMQAGLPALRKGTGGRRKGSGPVKTIFSAAQVKPAALVSIDPAATIQAKSGDDDVARLLVDAIASCQLALESYRAELAKGEDRVRERVKAALKEVLG